jgi:hypothetical protein
MRFLSSSSFLRQDVACQSLLRSAGGKLSTCVTYFCEIKYLREDLHPTSRMGIGRDREVGQGCFAHEVEIALGAAKQGQVL